MKRPQLLAVILGIVIFGLGTATGVLAHRLYLANTVNASEDWRVRYLNELHSRLSLNAEQMDKLNDILDDTRNRVREVRERYKPEMVQIKQDQIVQIRSVLKPEQVSEYNKIVAEQERKAKEQDARDRQIEAQRTAERQNREKQNLQGTGKRN
jgi:hypothetical protein